MAGGPVTDNTALTAKIEAGIDKSKLGAMEISSSVGGLAIKSADQAIEMAKLMSVSQQAVPPHCRNNPGICLAITLQAIEWRMSPFAVANKSYVVNDRVSFESQLIHAVVEQRAPITSRLRHSFSGSGETRRCKVWATAKGEDLPLEYESPEFKSITPKNSPLWKTKPDLQLFYNTSRDWARMYFPEVILGVYSDDELADSPIVSSGRVIEQAGEPRTLSAIASRVAEGRDTRETIVETEPQREPQSDQVSERQPPEAPAPAPPEEIPNMDTLADATKAACREIRAKRSIEWVEQTRTTFTQLAQTLTNDPDELDGAIATVNAAAEKRKSELAGGQKTLLQ